MATIQKRVSKRTGKVKWRADYMDASGTRRAKTFDTKGEASEWLTSTQHQLKTGVHTPDSTSVSFTEAARLFIQRASRDKLERSTIRQYKTHLDLHLLPDLGSMKLSRMTTPMLEGFIDELEQAGRSRAMICKLLTTLRSVLSEAQRRGLIAQNVALAVKRRPNNRRNGHTALPTKEELNAIITHVEGRWRPLLLTLLFTGIRSSEARGLSWDDIDLERGVLQVRRRADRWNELGAPKSKAGCRTIPLAPMLRKELESWRLSFPRGDLNLVFPNGAGNIETLANIHRRGFAPLLKRLGIVDQKGKHRFRIHDLRHAAASLLIEEGWSPKKIQTVLGHSSIQMTYDTYEHLWDDHAADQDGIARIEQRLRNGSSSLPN